MRRLPFPTAFPIFVAMENGSVTSGALNESIRALARRLGFERIGFCAARKTPHADFLDNWLGNGWHGTMEWLARTPEWRKDILSRYDWARSFIMVSIDYRSELPQTLPTDSILHNIARYARGPDYHHFYKPQLQRLEDEILHMGGPGTFALWYQDTGPFLERALAAQAGLGWVGKNTMLIDSQRGSWTLLALVVTSLDLAPDAPVTDHCGTCTRCLDACPTNAFPSPYQLDASRCISYLTIEHEGTIAPELRPAMGKWLYGCDICNEVCPWNSKAPHMAADDIPDLGGLTVAQILTGKVEHLMKRIAGTPLQRTGVETLRRNAAIVAGNLKDEKMLPSLEQALQTDDDALQEAVVWALLQYGTPKARALLARAQKYVVNEELRDKIIQELQGNAPEREPPA